MHVLRANIFGQNKQLHIRKWVEQLIADNEVALISQEEAGYTLEHFRFQLVTAEHFYIVGEILSYGANFVEYSFTVVYIEEKCHWNLKRPFFSEVSFFTLLFQPHKSMIKVFVSILLTNVQGNHLLSYCELHISWQGSTCHILQCSKINKSWEKCTKSNHPQLMSLSTSCRHKV